MNDDNLQHVGILGMKWGHRKASSSSISPDHALVSKIRNKKLKDMTDDEIRTAAKRMELVNALRKSGAGKGKVIAKMSNDDITAAMNRAQLKKEDWLSGVRKNKKIKDMTNAEVKATLDRHLLEKSYKQLAKQDFTNARKLVNAMMFLGS